MSVRYRIWLVVPTTPDYLRRLPPGVVSLRTRRISLILGMAAVGTSPRSWEKQAQLALSTESRWYTLRRLPSESHSGAQRPQPYTLMIHARLLTLALCGEWHPQNWSGDWCLSCDPGPSKTGHYSRPWLCTRQRRPCVTYSVWRTHSICACHRRQWRGSVWEPDPAHASIDHVRPPGIHEARSFLHSPRQLITFEISILKEGIK